MILLIFVRNGTLINISYYLVILSFMSWADCFTLSASVLSNSRKEFACKIDCFVPARSPSNSSRFAVVSDKILATASILVWIVQNHQSILVYFEHENLLNYLNIHKLVIWDWCFVQYNSDFMQLGFHVLENTAISPSGTSHFNLKHWFS